MDRKLTAFEAENKFAALPLAIDLVDESTGRILIHSSSFQKKIIGKWQLEINGSRRSFGQFQLSDVNSGEVKKLLLSVEVPDLCYGETAVLIVRCYDENGGLIGCDHFILPPPTYIMPPVSKEEYFTGVRFDVSQAMISSGKLSAVIDADGMRELRYNGVKLLSSGPRLALWRAQELPAKFAELNLDRMRISPDRFVSDGKSIECHALALPKKMELDELEFTQRFTPQDNGTIRYDMEFIVPECFENIPRLGVVMRLPAEMKNITFFGKGPFENYPGGNTGILSSYTMSADEMYPDADSAVSAGTRSGVRHLTLADDKEKKLEIIAGSTFCFSALPFSEYTIDDAAKAGKMPENDGEIHLHIDCRIGKEKKVSAGLYRLTLFFKA
jgi:beta-galactosidase